MAFSDPNISFGVTGLQGEAVNNPTALDFSTTGNPTLFVAQQNGEIWRLEIERQVDGADADTLSDFVVTGSSVISDIKLNTANYNDDGTTYSATDRQMTGLVTTTDANGNDVLYVNSSDARFAVGNDINLDTNSSQIHKLTLNPTTGAVISNVAIIRGLPRSEESHSVNGLELAIDPVTGHQMLWVAVGGNTNKGAPGNNFAGTIDYPYSGAILKIDLDIVESYDVRIDGNGDPFILDLPTLDDPTRSNVDLTGLNILNPDDAPNFTLDDNGTGTTGVLNPDWAGGNNGLNAAKVVDKVLVSDNGQLQFVDNPLQIHSPGYRNPYDVLVTQDGEVFTWDNGPNTGWGGQVKPFVDNTPSSSNYVEDWTQELATNLFNESGSTTHGDQLHYIGDTSDQFGPYGGFTSPIRAAAAVLNATFNSDGSYKPGAGNPLLNTNSNVIFADETEAQAYLNSIMVIYNKQGNGSGSWADVTSTTGLPADLYDVVSGYDWIHPGSSISNPTDYYDGTSVQDGTLYSPESQLFNNNQDGSLITTPASTNGLAEYTATNFDSALDGVIVAASFNGNLYFQKPIDTNDDGRTDSVQSLGTINGFGSIPLTVTTLGDGGLPGVFIDNDNDGVDDFAGLIVAATYGADNVSFFIPGGEAADPNTDLDLDGLDNIDDSHVGDPLDGRGVIVDENETLIWQFELTTPTTPPGAIPNTNSIAGDIGINAVWRNGVDPQVSEDGSPALYDPDVWSLGGASTFVSIDEADTGNAVGNANDQADVLGIGFQIQDNLGGITIMSEMLNAFSYTPNIDASKTWDGGEKFGLMVGPGDQSTFVEATIAVDTTGSTTQYGLQLIVEENDVPNTVFVEIPGIEAPVGNILQIAFDVDLSFGAEAISARARYVDNGIFTNWVSTSAIALPGDVKDAILGNYNNSGSTTGAVVGLVASAPSGDDSFAASWDWVEVTGQEAVTTTGTVLYRWNAGTADIAAVDGGMDWIADASVVTAGPSGVYTGNITNLHFSASQYTFPTGLFTQERFDPASGAEMSLQFGDGLASGTYAVRLLMGESYFNPGVRQFDVSVEDQLFLDDIDLSATLGKGNGGMFEWVGQVSDGTIDIDFQRVLENPLINGVEILQIGTGLPKASLSVTPSAGSEVAGTQVTLTVTTSIAVSGNQTLDLALSGSGITASDFTTAVPTSITILDGATTASITLNVADDTDIESLETATFTISNPSAGVELGATVVGTLDITDNDAQTTNGSVVYRWNAGGPDIAAIDGGPDWIADASVLVGGSPDIYNGNITNIDASVPSEVPVGLFTQLRWDRAGGTEMALEFGEGNLASGTYAVRLFMGDNLQAPGRRLFDVTIEDQLFLDNVDISGTFGEDIGGMFEWIGQVTDGTIDIDFDRVLRNPFINGVEILQVDTGPTLPAASLSVTPSVGSEDAGTQVTVLVTLSEAVSGNQTLDLALSGSGITPSDFTTAVPSSITVLDGATTASITLNVADDTDIESLETATFTISNPSAGVILGTTVAGTLDITDNDEPPNQPPSFTTPTTFSIAEHLTEVGTVSASDPENDTIVYAIAGGADASLLTIDSNSGELSFVSGPDFEAPQDDGGDNVYDVQISAADGPNTVTQNIAITVNDNPIETGPNYAPTIAPISDIVVDELLFANAQVSATDADVGDTIELSVALEDANGAPVTGYTFTDNGDGTGDFSWSTPDLPVTSVFTAIVTASDGVNADVTTDFDITVNDVTSGTVLYRWNAGSSNITAIDGGPDWIADASLINGPSNVYTGNISNLDASTPADSTPVTIFQQERWDPPTGNEMEFEFGAGALASGTYAVRLFMGESYFNAGVRQFDVSVEDQLFLDDIDLSATLGKGNGGMFEWVGQVSDGTIDIDFQRVLENPLINGIEILQIDTIA